MNSGKSPLICMIFKGSKYKQLVYSWYLLFWIFSISQDQHQTVIHHRGQYFQGLHLQTSY